MPLSLRRRQTEPFSVVESGNISYRIAQRVKDQLEKSGCRILGAVLNRTGGGTAAATIKSITENITKNTINIMKTVPSGKAMR